MKRVLAAFVLLAAFSLGQATTLPSHTWRALKLFPGTLLEATYLPTPFKSIQNVSITVAGVASNTATITSVTPANTILMFQGDSNNETSATGFHEGSEHGYFTLTDATTVTLTHANTGFTTIGNAVVVEFAAGVLKSATQCGSITIGASTTATATITSVSTTKSILTFTGFTDNITGGASADNQFDARLSLTNATTVTATMGGSGGNGQKVGYCVAEGK